MRSNSTTKIEFCENKKFYANAINIVVSVYKVNKWKYVNLFILAKIIKNVC